MLNNQIIEGIELEKKYCQEAPESVGNVSKLHQAFINILSNSIQAIDVFGKIKISTSVVDSSIIIEISDTGRGISNENLSKITDPFFTTKDPGEGTGLGLSITYTIVKQHKGELEYTSELDKGTTAIITLPLKK
jgi:signal transduction histidine kinase